VAFYILFLLVVKVRECQEQHTHSYQDFITLHCVHILAQQLTPALTLSVPGHIGLLLCYLRFGRVAHLVSSILLLKWSCDFYRTEIITQFVKNFVRGDENQVICFLWPYLCILH